jgi:hypothetical protein
MIELAWLWLRRPKKVGGAFAQGPRRAASPDMEPFQVFEDDRVRVSAILVDHFPIWPAFAFRFDTDEGSVTDRRD